jgi:hypothetical protein
MKKNSGMPLFVEQTGDPQVGQKARLTMFPLSAAFSQRVASPDKCVAARGKAMWDA